MAFSLGEYQDIFLEEADDQLRELNQNLLSLEKDPGDEDTINNIFRAAHSLKSSAAFVGLNDLSDLAHKMENLFQGIRDKTMAATPEIISVLFECFDMISSVIDTVSQGETPDHDLSGLIAKIKRISASGVTEPASSAPSRPAAETKPAEDAFPKITFDGEEKKALKRGFDGGKVCYEIIVMIDPNAQMRWVKAQLILANLEHLGIVVKTLPGQGDINDDVLKDVFRVVFLTNSSFEEIEKACAIDLILEVGVREISLVPKDGKYVLKLGDKSVLFKESAESAPAVVVSAPVSSPVIEDADVIDAHDDVAVDDEHADDDKRKGDRKGTVLKTVKVSVDKLDQLLNNVGELVIANSGFYRLYEDLRRLDADKTVINEFKNRMEQMSRIAKDLQSGIMKTRMVQIGQVFSRFNRLVRDLAIECDKDVVLVIKGEDTELDKKVIDVIGEPLMHLIRNSMDHGLESREERASMQKAEQCTVTLNAHQAGNQIFVEVSDDGRGLNAAKIRKKALEKGLVTPEVLSNMDDEDVYNFIFQPGFSTAEKVSDISGRGVGMNVVKETVSELNGTVSIETEPGMGTRFIMAFPLTLAIIPAIMVKVQREMYAIPLSDVIETIKISNDDITTIEGHEVINLRGEILSLLRLNKFVGIASALDATMKIPVVVVGYGNRKIGLIVDFLEGKQENCHKIS